MKKLIVNADDYGLAPNVTDGIIDACQKGIVSSTSLMVGGADVTRAAQLAKQVPGMSVGIHLTLVDGNPIGATDSVHSLLGDDGRFLNDYRQFVRRYIAGSIKRSDIRAECAEQINRFLDLGLKPTHLDSHQHLHLLPGVFEVVHELGVEYGIRRLRIPLGGSMKIWHLGVGGSVLEILSSRGRRIIRQQTHRLPHCDNFLGAQYSCRLDKQILLKLIDQVKEGTTELMCHPGRYNRETMRIHPWGRNWQGELDALMDAEVKERIRHNNITIVGQLTS